MHYIGLNLFAIGSACLLGLLLGVMRLSLSGRLKGAPLWLLPVAAVCEFWLAAILAGALILAPVDADPWTIALGTAIVIWAGFVLPVLVVSYGAARRPIASLALDAGHWLLVMVGQAGVLHLVGLAKP